MWECGYTLLFAYFLEFAGAQCHSTHIYYQLTHSILRNHGNKLTDAKFSSLKKTIMKIRKTQITNYTYLDIAITFHLCFDWIQRLEVKQYKDNHY